MKEKTKTVMSNNDGQADVALSSMATDILVLIFTLLPKSDLNNVWRVNKRFHAVVVEHFVKSLYGHVFLFNRWQENKVESIKKHIQLFKRNHQVTLFNQPQQRNSIAKVLHYLLLAFVFYFIMQQVNQYIKLASIRREMTSIESILAGAYKTYESNRNKIDKLKKLPLANLLAQTIAAEDRKLNEWKGIYHSQQVSLHESNDKIFQSFMIALILSASIIGLIIYKYISARNSNNLYQQSLINQQQFNALIEIIDQHKPLLDELKQSIVNGNQIQVGVTQVQQMFSILSAVVNSIETNVVIQNKFLKQQISKRRKTLDGAEFEDFSKNNPTVAVYSKNMFTLYHRINLDRSLIAPGEVKLFMA